MIIFDWQTAILLINFSLLGLILGSFANLYFYRIPKNLSMIKLQSICPQCNHPILYRDTIPILSFLFLKGKCRFCGSKISWKTPLIEMLCMVLFILIAFQFQDLSPLKLSALLFFSFLVFLMGGIDLVTFLQSEDQYGIIPDHLTWILAVSGLGFSFFNPFFDGKWTESLWGGLSGMTFMLLLRWVDGKILKKKSVGFADVKMVAAAGLFLGFKGVIIALMVSSITGTIFSLARMAQKKLNIKSLLPFAPFFAAGCMIALFVL